MLTIQQERERRRREYNLRGSYHHRSAQKANAGAEIATQALRLIDPVAAIPSKFAQCINSGYMLFRPEPKIHEKIAHAAQCVLAATYIAILIFMLFNDEKCQIIKGTVCKLLLLNELLFQGILLLSWIPSELYRESLEEFEERSNDGSQNGSALNTPSLERQSVWEIRQPQAQQIEPARAHMSVSAPAMTNTPGIESAAEDDITTASPDFFSSDTEQLEGAYTPSLGA